MPGLLYFLPDRTRDVMLPALAAAGIGHAFERTPTVRGVQCGPGNAAGLVLADSRHVEEIGYFPQRQTWRSVPKTEAWVGMFSAQQPGPGDLRRERQLDGHLVTLLDGAQWLVPVARGHAEEDGDLRWYHTLPRRATLDDEGRWTAGAVLPRYAPLLEAATRWEEAQAAGNVRDQEGGRAALMFDFAGTIEAAAEVLAANYLVGPAEIDLLGLLTEEIAVEVLNALIDIPTRLEWIKKKLAAARAGGNTGDGPAGLIEDTARP